MLTRDGTAKNPSRGTKFSRANGDNSEKIVFPVQLSRRAELATIPDRLIHIILLKVLTIYILY